MSKPVCLLLLLSLISSTCFADEAVPHNAIRAALSEGKKANLGASFDKPYRFSKQRQPKRPLPPMQASSNLRASASKYAKKCKYKHSEKPGVGENLFVGAGHHWTLENAVAAWAYEAKGYKYGRTNNSKKWMRKSSRCRTWRDKDIPSCGHYTQIIWAKTTQVGCKVQHCGKVKRSWGRRMFGGDPSTLIVCQYTPQGNIHGEVPYVK